jgi:hypothetical protein
MNLQNTNKICNRLLNNSLSFKLHGNKLNYYRKQANKLLDCLTEEEYDKAVNWYAEAHEFAKDLAYQESITLDKICQVIAVLSPGVNWELNKKDAFNLCVAYKLGNGMDSYLKVSTYGFNKEKAIRILNGKEKLIDKAMKTYAFYTNILTAGNNSNVTVDRHAYKALNNIKKGGSVTVNKEEYKLLEHAYKQLAVEHNLTPPQLQAVIWVAYKKTHKR